ncbi:MAG TPA: aldo/keto reductase [Vineibacter sp.]|nr:aldo/keto reductase [Vineibacter sp.]
MVERIEVAPGYDCSRLIKGNWQLAERHGPPVDRQAALEGMRRFVEAGIDTFDCADHYVGVEELIGEFRRRYPELAPRLKVHTKVVPDRDVLPRIRRADLEHLVDRARQRLGMDCLDLVQFHWWDYDVPGYVESMGWLADMGREGKIRHVGTTNFDVARLREIVGAGVTVASNQLQYSVLDRRPEGGMVDFARANRIALLCYGTVAGGFLAARWLGQPEPTPPLENRSLVKYRLIIDEFGDWTLFQSLLRTLEGIARKHAASITAVATRWVLDRPGAAAAIVGARTDAHLADLLAAESLRLTDADRAAINAVLAEARGPAGECYALEREPGGRHASIMWTNQNLKGVGAR